MSNCFEEVVIDHDKIVFAKPINDDHAKMIRETGEEVVIWFDQNGRVDAVFKLPDNGYIHDLVGRAIGLEQWCNLPVIKEHSLMEAVIKLPDTGHEYIDELVNRAVKLGHQYNLPAIKECSLIKYDSKDELTYAYDTSDVILI